ncbi:MAG TPA: lytic transglycosylase domain-containing protein [Bryobacteraceae bacterium]
MTLHAPPAGRVGSYSMKCFRSVAMLLAVVPAFGGEYVVLSSGLKLHADRHEQVGTQMKLFHNGGVIEVPASLISGFEEEEVVAPVAVVNSAAVNDAASAKPDTAPRAVLDPKAQDAKAMLREAARRSGLPPEFVESVARVESGLRQDAVSPKGAIGVMQLMPGTAKTLGADPHDAAQNIDAGTRLLRELLLKYDGDVVKALAAYNAGEGAVERYQGMPPYNETRWYVKKVIDGYQKSAGQ